MCLFRIAAGGGVEEKKKRSELGVFCGVGGTPTRLGDDRDEEGGGWSWKQGVNGAGLWEGMGVRAGNNNEEYNKDKFHLLVLRCREYEDKQPPLRGLQGAGGSRPDEEETFQEEAENRGVC